MKVVFCGLLNTGSKYFRRLRVIKLSLKLNSEHRDYNHIPVMLAESIEGLNISNDGIYVDGTVGGGGHSKEIAARLSEKGRLICIDKDKDAHTAAEETLKGYKNVTFVHDDFSNINAILASLGVSYINGAILDLGVSSHQLDEAVRGFSFMQDARLDMRMDQGAGISAYNVVNEYSEKELANIFFKYGEERFSRRIAELIVKERRNFPISTTLQLADIISSAVPKAAWEKNKNPATRVFQAIRIEVNNELNFLEQALEDFVGRLKPEGRLCVISFHSLEDRIVKNTFKKLENPCECPRDLPICVCGKKPVIKTITKRPISPTEDEIEKNIRCRSAKLRIISKK